jgi:uncharacterized protein YrzB (UPF0473 family)
MNDNKKDMELNEEESLFCTLTDEDGNEIEFELIGTVEVEGVTYHAMIPADQQGEEQGFYEYVILKTEVDEDGEEMLVTLDDDAEFDKVADIFDDMFSEEIDLDQ